MEEDEGSPRKPNLEQNAFVRPNLSIFDSPEKKSKAAPDQINEPKAAFKKIAIDEFDDSQDISGTDPDGSLPATTTRNARNMPADEPLATQTATFKLPCIDEVLIGTAQSLASSASAVLPAISTTLSDDDDEDDFAAVAHRARCPMCNKPVDAEDISAIGEMNTRMQERFCRSHQKKTALDDWQLKGYPDIDWEMLDSRISKHHKYIKRLINGENSYYRRTFNEKINAGKDRSLLKLTSNLTPGYYGPRGLRAISENIMGRFTPLLKRRSVKDRLISARGVTPYVQSVLVPEVAVLMIMDDLAVDIEEARDILTESSAIGELVNEEIRDVVRRRVDDSDEDESGSDDE